MHFSHVAPLKKNFLGPPLTRFDVLVLLQNEWISLQEPPTLFLQLETDFFSLHLGPNLEQLIQQLVKNDPNCFGIQPTSKTTVELLAGVKVQEHGPKFAGEDGELKRCCYRRRTKGERLGRKGHFGHFKKFWIAISRWELDLAWNDIIERFCKFKIIIENFKLCLIWIFCDKLEIFWKKKNLWV